MNKTAIVIGAGFAGMSAATFLAKSGWKVKVIEKHSMPGGRARKLDISGFSFDMGPSWYWMPDVFERYFNQFEKTVSNYYTLQRLNPSYRIYWKEDYFDVPANYAALEELFESIEEGSAVQLKLFLKEAAYKYEVGINQLVHQPGLSVIEFFNLDLLKGLFRLDVFKSMKAHVGRYFRHPKLQQMLEFPVLFLGAMPEKTPALYSLMNYADIIGGTWYPEGGMYSIVDAMYKLAIEQGVEFCFNENAGSIEVINGKASAVKTTNNTYHAEAVLSAADYHFTETQLLKEKYRTYSDKYWESRILAPSCLLYYVGLNKRITGITHHTLFFDTDFSIHGKEIYETQQWPTSPLFYVSATSVTDDTVAPEGCENLFILIPVAAGLADDTENIRNKYFDMVIERMELHFKQALKSSILFKQTYAHSNFIADYNSFKGNAYGLANTLFQTSILKPSCRSKKVDNLFYAGQLTVPGPGVPPSLISGEVVANEMEKWWKGKK